MEGEVVFPASMGRRTRLVTYGVGWGVFLGVPTLLGVAFAVGFGEPGPMILPAMAAAGMALVQAVRTRGFGLGSEGLTVRRLVRPLTIDLEDVAEVRSDPDPPPVTFHLWALRGFYGLHGAFWSRELGRYRAYVTDADNLVEIVTRDGGRLFLSPDDRDGFLDRLESLLRERRSDAPVDRREPCEEP